MGVSAQVSLPAVIPDVEEEVRAWPRTLPPYKVVVLDCQCHSFDDVEIALCRVIRGMTRAKAHQHAYEIHTTGASALTGSLPLAQG